MCPNCGKTIPDGSTFCPGCATKIPNGKTKVAVLVPYRKGRKWGFCDRDRTMVIPAVYDGVRPFREGLARVNLNGKWGFIDIKGNLAIPTVYDKAGFFRDGLAAVTLNRKHGFIDTKGTQYWED